MTAWWLYAIAIASPFALAAWTAEWFAWSRGLPSRGAWLLALLLGAGWPLLAWLGWLPFLQPAGASIAAGSTSPLGQTAQAAYGLLPAFDVAWAWLWALSSGGMVVVAVVSHRRLGAAIRLCRVASMSGVRVWISPTEGPAALGLTRPRIVMPAWILASPARQRRMALLHELEHLRAGDLPLLAGGYLLACATPWNPVAWWMLARFRRAVELDCDRRVLARRVDRRAYGELLVRTARSGAPRFATVTGLLARRSSLRRRIERIAGLGRRPRRRPWVPAVLALGCVAAVVAVPTPGGQLSSAVGTYWIRELPADNAPAGQVFERGSGSLFGRAWRFQRGGELRRLEEVTVGGVGVEHPAGRARFEPREETGSVEAAAPEATGGGVLRARPRR